MTTEQRLQELTEGDVGDMVANMHLCVGAAWVLLGGDREGTSLERVKRARELAPRLWDLIPFLKALGRLALEHPERARRLWAEALEEPMPFGQPAIGMPMVANQPGAAGRERDGARICADQADAYRDAAERFMRGDESWPAWCDEVRAHLSSQPAAAERPNAIAMRLLAAAEGREAELRGRLECLENRCNCADDIGTGVRCYRLSSQPAAPTRTEAEPGQYELGYADGWLQGQRDAPGYLQTEAMPPKEPTGTTQPLAHSSGHMLSGACGAGGPVERTEAEQRGLDAVKRAVDNWQEGAPFNEGAAIEAELARRGLP